jgi:hypothetical protein
MFAPIHHDTIASCAVLAQEHPDAARDIPKTSSPPKQSPCTISVSGTAATPHPLISPPSREGHPSDHLNTRPPLLIASRTSPMRRCKSVVLTAER